MLPKLHNNISFKNTSINKNYTPRNIKKNNNNNIASKSLKNINNNLSTKSNSIFRNLLLKDKTENLETKINGGILNNKKHKYSNIQSVNKDYDNKSRNKKNKANNVTNNICIIIKTSENPDKEEDDVEINQKNISNNLSCCDSFISKKNNQNRLSFQTENINYDLKSNNFKNKKLENNKKKLKRFNNSFIFKNNQIKNKKNIMTKTKSTNYKINNYQKRTKLIINKINDNTNDNNNDNNNNNKENIKYRYQNKNSSLLNSKNNNYYIKRKIPSIKKRTLFNSPDKENGGYSKQEIITDVFNRNTSKNLDNTIYSPLNKIRASYKDLIQEKKKSLGINLSKREKKKIKSELFINYDKKREEIEKEILLNDEIIKNEMNNDDNNNKEGHVKKILSSDLSKKANLTYHNLNTKRNLHKINDENNKNLINNEINNSKSDISYIPTESNKDDNKTNINLNSFMNENSKPNIKYKKRNIKRKFEAINCKKSFNSIKSINSVKSINSIKSLKSVSSDNRNNALNNSSSSLFNTSKSCINMLIKKNKMKRNISLILHDIKKLLNKDKNDKNEKEVNKSPKKSRSIQKNEILMLKDNEDGKTIHCIQKLSKDKVQEEIQIKKIDPEKDNEEETSKNITGLLKNIKKRVLKYKDNYKNLEIKIPGREIEALKRIKTRINNYQKTQKINRSRNNKYVKIQKFKSFSYFHAKIIYNKIYLYKIKKSKSLKIEHKNEYSIFNKLKFY